jgi:hypothetical protein
MSFCFLLILQDEKEQLIQSKNSVASLVGRSKTIIQLKPRSPDHVLKSTISVKAICDYRQIEVRAPKGRRRKGKPQVSIMIIGKDNAREVLKLEFRGQMW